MSATSQVRTIRERAFRGMRSARRAPQRRRLAGANAVTRLVREGRMSDYPNSVHESVQPDAVLQMLALRDGDLVVDCTLGAGGHSERILEATQSGRVIAFDRDRQIFALAKQRLVRFGDRITFVQSDYEQFDRALRGAAIHGALLDLGVSSLQIDRAERGFSFQVDGPLDMRMDDQRGNSAADLLARLPAAELTRVLREIGDEPNAKRIADEIVLTRKRAPIRRTCELADLIARALRRTSREAVTKTLARVFMALRIVVNDELGQLERTLPRLIERLAPKGRLVVLSFHGGEDRIVKHAFKQAESQGLGEILTDRPLEASPLEIAANPRARSSKLRAFERSSVGAVEE